jgi:hypothetical protein
MSITYEFFPCRDLFLSAAPPPSFNSAINFSGQPQKSIYAAMKKMDVAKDLFSKPRIRRRFGA